MYKHKRGITKLLLGQESFDLSDCNLQDIQKGLGLVKVVSNDLLLFIRKILLNYKTTTTKIVNDFNNIEEFDETRYIEFMDYKSKFPYDSKSKKFNILKYGYKIGNEKYINSMENLQEYSPYKPKYWMLKGFTKKESLEQIEKYKKNKTTNLEGFIKRHGKEKGLKLFCDFQHSSKHTKEKYILKYGNERGLKKWETYLKSKDSMSLDWALKKAKGNPILAKKIYNKRKESIKTNMDKLIEKYGSEELAYEEYIKIVKSRTVKFNKASKESLVILLPFYKKLLKKYNKEDIKLGVDENHELHLYDRDNKKSYFYDFAIKSKKIIIEYNGEKWHPNYEKYSVEYLLENWNHIRSEKNATFYIEKEKSKLNFAISKGYEVLVLWSSDSVEENIKK